MENKSNFKEYIIPSLVLVLICFFVTLALAFTNQATKPQIEKIAKENADKARAEVLKDSGGFEEYKGKLNEGIEGYYIAQNKNGVAVTSTAKSFGGLIVVMIGIDKDGAITGVKVTQHSDTPGLGTKAMTKEYLSCYKGDKELKAASVKDESNVDYIVGASISSNGVYHAVQGALKQFHDAGGVK